ncbi:PLP-dependent aspartate aminotransferase family protein [Rhodoferax ferrireducens]|uniref:trans-sulfuration enzyme family protein n=1 Tax=Rhodoferax ferrireducens TaxID=192843 RepID=UPI00298DBBC4|nr:PLP-dependent aspartate aminotransferase family protein [Rhodoferax ferrireducens]WPC66879.1 PLP-dependent aspartate aminotransferase family protein [Rhodoferax ferrireducens]
MTHLRTRAVHAGQHPDPGTGAIATPISQTTAFGYGTLEHGAAIFAGEAPGYRYSRFANPTVAALEAKMADLEGAQAAVAFSSGTAATSSVLLGLLNPGDEIAFLGPLYGGTEGLFRAVGERFGIRVVDATQQGLAASLTPATRMVWVETLTNPSLRLHDLAEVAAIAKARGVLTVADNTFCTPCLVRPLAYGIDLAMHSMTKYLGGHGDATGGIVAGSVALIAPVRKTGLGHVGGNLSPQEAFLFLRGIKTLPLRMAAHCEGAAAVAHFLAGHPAVRVVHYPGLASHPQHALARRLLQGGFGGMVAFELVRNERSAAAAVLNRLELFTQAVSLGDVDSLACHPASTTHSFVTAAVRAQNGITEGLIRLSVGIEHPDDLMADLEHALRHAV